MTGDLITGPCIFCGDRDYPLSMGGPTICPSCDCGDFGLAKVQRQAAEIERLRAELRNPIMRRKESDRFGISICWDDHMISGMQKSTDEVWRIVHIVKMLRDKYPDLHAHLAKIADQMLKLIERTQADRRYDAAAIEELRRDFPDLFTKAV